MEAQDIFNLKFTLALKELFAVPAQNRDDDWREEVLYHLPTAGFMLKEQQTVVDGKGFSYMALYIPKLEEGFSPVCIIEVLDFVCEESLGIIVFDEDGSTPLWSFTLGDLWNYRENTEFYPTNLWWRLKRSGAEGNKSDTGSRSVLVSAPSQKLLPDVARRAIAKVLEQDYQVENPGVLLMTDSTLDPAMNLVFSVFEEDFSSRERYENATDFIQWALPQEYGLYLVKKSSFTSDSYTPLAEQ